jgi:hypothetical protein
MTEQPENISEQIGTDPAQSGGMDESAGGFDDNTGGESYHGYSVDDEDQPQSTHDSLTDSGRVAEPLDEGYSPPEKWSPGEGYGNTPLEEELGETLDQRIGQEIPEPDPYEAAATEGESVTGEVGDARTGRLVDEEGGTGQNTEKDLVADDIGVDGAGASAEEAAVHTIDE